MGATTIDAHKHTQTLYNPGQEDETLGDALHQPVVPVDVGEHADDEAEDDHPDEPDNADDQVGQPDADHDVVPEDEPCTDQDAAPDADQADHSELVAEHSDPAEEEHPALAAFTDEHKATEEEVVIPSDSEDECPNDVTPEEFTMDSQPAAKFAFEDPHPHLSQSPVLADKNDANPTDVQALAANASESDHSYTPEDKRISMNLDSQSPSLPNLSPSDMAIEWLEAQLKRLRIQQSDLTLDIYCITVDIYF